MVSSQVRPNIFGFDHLKRWLGLDLTSKVRWSFHQTHVSLSTVHTGEAEARGLSGAQRPVITNHKVGGLAMSVLVPEGSTGFLEIPPDSFLGNTDSPPAL